MRSALCIWFKNELVILIPWEGPHNTDLSASALQLYQQPKAECCPLGIDTCICGLVNSFPYFLVSPSIIKIVFILINSASILI